jgi:hypothetical protein
MSTSSNRRCLRALSSVPGAFDVGMVVRVGEGVISAGGVGVAVGVRVGVGEAVGEGEGVDVAGRVGEEVGMSVGSGVALG